MNERVTKLALIADIVVIYVGFRLVTQAGQPMAHIQNDGFALWGGVLILIGGIMLGVLASQSYPSKKK